MNADDFDAICCAILDAVARQQGGEDQKPAKKEGHPIRQRIVSSYKEEAGITL